MKAPSVSSKIIISAILAGGLCLPALAHAQLIDEKTREVKREQDMKVLQEKFSWWPTDAKPAPVKDARGGYWWWPKEPGSVKTLWGNRGYVYVLKVIYDYKANDEQNNQAAPAVAQPAGKPEMKPSLLIKKIIKNVKIYFDYNKADLRDDHTPILKKAITALEKNPTASILITGNCDARGSDEYNLKLGKKRSEMVKKYMLDNGIPEDRIKIVSRGKLDAISPVKDVIGMQKDRNAQFMVAEVEEFNVPADQIPQDQNVTKSDDGKYTVEQKETVESEPKASTREYTIAANDSLWKIAAKEMGNGNRWKYLYELNKDRIKNPNKLKKGTVIIIPVE
ncbi:MAG: OmpA family protein [Candidatus Omnitrophica bacterium]|nr:OmpA family protein [Candidatus Omnitrophota bacterium]